MFSSKDLRTAILLCSGTLLAVSPLHAAIKTKPTAPVARKTISKTSSHKTSTHVASVSASHKSHKGGLKAVAAKPKSHGQQAIDSARTAEIQQALIREHYLDGEPSGQWDQATRDALTRFQADHHWQTKIIPDSRALIQLGLGPSQQNLLNPESAAISPSYRSVAGGSN